MFPDNIVPLFNSWLGWSGSIPELFHNVESYEQSFLKICKWLSKLTEYAEQMGYQINTNTAGIEKLAKELADFYANFADDFETYYKERICEWLGKNLSCMIGNATKFVQFGLTDNGHLAITIPNNWDFLNFYTDMDTDSENFGKLQIVY